MFSDIYTINFVKFRARRFQSNFKQTLKSAFEQTFHKNSDNLFCEILFKTARIGESEADSTSYNSHWVCL